MRPRPFRLLLAIPALLVLWGFANTIGLTAALTADTAAAKFDSWTIPGLTNLLQVPKPATAPDEAPGGPSMGTAAQFNTARAQLGKLPVKGRAPKTGYERSQFGSAWSDAVGHSAWTRNGCDTRNDLLKRDLARERFKAGTNGCKVISGDLLRDPYTGQRIHFIYGNGNLIDAEHVVALGDVWTKGGQQISRADRESIANDPANLIAVDAGENRSKGDADAASWLPKYKPFRCSYVSRQVAVKTTYHLWVTPAEKSAISRVLSPCPR